METTKSVEYKWKRRKVRVRRTWGKVVSSWIRSISFTGSRSGDKWYGQSKGFITITLKTGKKYKYYGSYADYKYMSEATGPVSISGAGSRGWRIGFFDSGGNKLADKRFAKKRG